MLSVTHSPTRSCETSHTFISNHRVVKRQSYPLCDTHLLIGFLFEQAEAAKQAFKQEMYTAKKLPHGQKPNEGQWRAGQYQDRLQALQAFALDLAQPSQLSLALESLQVRP